MKAGFGASHIELSETRPIPCGNMKVAATIIIIIYEVFAEVTPKGYCYEAPAVKSKNVTNAFLPHLQNGVRSEIGRTCKFVLFTNIMWYAPMSAVLAELNVITKTKVYAVWLHW